MAQGRQNAPSGGVSAEKNGTASSERVGRGPKVRGACAVVATLDEAGTFRCELTGNGHWAEDRMVGASLDIGDADEVKAAMQALLDDYHAEMCEAVDEAVFEARRTGRGRGEL